MSNKEYFATSIVKIDSLIKETCSDVAMENKDISDKLLFLHNLIHARNEISVSIKAYLKKGIIEYDEFLQD